MELQSVPAPIEFIASLGGLHDVRIESFRFDTDAQVLTLETGVYFDDDPEMKEKTPRVLVFAGITEIGLDIDLSEGLRISNLEVEAGSSVFALTVDLNIGGGVASKGRRSISAKFESLSIQQ
jgi:hypothetical protein